jgi:Flp pilus assembly protein TadG
MANRPSALDVNLVQLAQAFLSCDRGLAAVEFAVIAPVLALVMICTVDIGLGFYRKMQVQNAAQAGAEYAATHGFSATAIASAMASATGYSSVQASPQPYQYCGCASTSGVATATCGTNCAGGAQAGTYVAVSAQAVYTTLLPYPLLPDTYTFTAQSTVRIQ